MINIKIIIKELCPPLLWRFALITKRKLYKHRRKPRWYVVQKGPIAGCHLYVNREGMMFSEMIDGSYDSFFWERMREHNLNEGLVLDVGGHIGYHALAFSALVGENGRVIVFEPNQINRNRMKMHFDKNKSLGSRIETRPYAVADAKGVSKFSFSDDVDEQKSSGSHLDISQRAFHEKSYSGFLTEDVRIERLDDVISTSDKAAISVIKIDVEGAEGLVLAGAIEILKNHKPLLMIEIHSVVAMDAVYQIIIPLGYKIDILAVDRDSRCFVACYLDK